MLDIDPDKIFEEKTISEIEVIQKKIQDEIERKKEELRTMVGERYRDLIQAADTISDMQQTAAGVINRIQTMEELCGAFQERQLLGFQLDVSKALYCTLAKCDSTGIGLAVQVKILVAIPEQIWVAVEKQDYLLGTQLFLLARHIKTGLHLENSHLLEEIMPVVSRQWSAILYFQDRLVTGALRALAAPDVASVNAAKYLCVFALLENMDGEALLNRFLQVRQSALSLLLLEGDDKANVKHRICASLHMLLNTLSLLHLCFVEARGGQQDGLLWQHLFALTQAEGPLASSHSSACLTSLEILDALGLGPTSLRFLPTVIRDFRPSNKSCNENISLDQVRSHTAKWLESLHTFLKDALTSLLDLITSIRALQSVRDLSLKEQQALSGWDIALQKLQLPCGLDIWDAYYQPIVSCRVRVLTEQQWISALASTRQKLADQLRAILRDRNYQPEHDLRWLVWREHATDIPHQPVHAKFDPPSNGLLLKCQGYSPRIESLCQSLDGPLAALLQELAAYVQDSDVDRNEIQQHLHQCSSHHLQEFCQHLKENCLSGATGRDEACVALVARLLSALCDLSPAVKSCFLPFTVHSSSKNILGSSTAWTDMVNILQESSTQAWIVWQDLVSSRIDALLLEKLIPESGSLSAILSHSTPWEEHSMEEHGEEGGRLHSVIRVPAQPSLVLQDVLSHACQVLGAAQPHTIPSDVKIAFVEKLVSNILGQFREALKMDLPQAQAVQFLLDVMFLSSSLVPRSQKSLSQHAQQICQSLEEKIDPFDLDVFTPYIQNNVRQSVRHMQCLLGVLISCWPEKLASMWTSSSSSFEKGTEQPSLMAVCPAVSWFPLLPVVLAGSASTSGPGSLMQQPVPREKSQMKSGIVTRSSPKKRAEPMENLKSGAAAFFGAMSTDWFS